MIVREIYMSRTCAKVGLYIRKKNVAILIRFTYIYCVCACVLLAFSPFDFDFFLQLDDLLIYIKNLINQQLETKIQTYKDGLFPLTYIPSL